jgi:hypothetical protein
VLLPPILKARSHGAGGGSVGDFMSRLGALGKANGAGGYAPPEPMSPIMPPMHGLAGAGPTRFPGAMSPAQKRRRDVLCVLLALVGFTFLVAMAASSTAFWALQLTADLVLGAYVVALLRIKSRRDAQRRLSRPGPMTPVPSNLATVTPLRPRVIEPAPALRRSASW